MLKRFICLFIVLLLLPIQSWAVEANIVVRSAPLIKAAETKNGMVRVYLSSLGSVTKLDLTVVGSYSVDGAVSFALYDGQQISIGFDTASGQITLSAGGVSYAMGQEMSLRRHQASGQSALKIAQANRPNNLYPGDLQLTARKSGTSYKLYPIVHVYIEYYLYGVVPYEMSSSWPSAALQAQAVAARTYTLNRMNGRTDNIYDLVDTSSDQVYNGYVGTETNATRAVDATRGIVIMSNGKLSGTYYTASNGGQTEAVANVWGSTAYGYLGVKDDPFDHANPNSNRRRMVVYPNFNNTSQSSALKSLLTAKAQSLYGSSVNITAINSITPHTPKYDAPSRLYTRMDFGVTLTNGSTGVLSFSIFDELESPLNMSINSSKNELWWVERDGVDFVIRVGRYGHGVGMSQRGAQQMADMGYTYDQILGFYFEGCERVQYTFTHTILPSIGIGGGPIVSTEAPATIAPGATSNARVQLAGVGDVLPLRYSPSDSGRVLAVVPNGASVAVMYAANGWILIQYGEIRGFVPAASLVITGPQPENTSASATNITQWGVVTGSESLNLRSGPSYDSSIIGYMPGATVLPILEVSGSWARVQYGQQIGWCAMSYLTLRDTYPIQETPGGTSAMVSLSGGYGSAPLRSTASPYSAVLLHVDHGTQVNVLSNDGTWCRVTVGSVTGYMLASALDFSATGTLPTEPPLGDQEIYAIVNSEASTLNLRAGPSTGSDIITEIPWGTKLVVTSYGSEWCAVRWGTLSGYVMTEYLRFDDQLLTPAPSVPGIPAGTAAYTLVNADMHMSANADSEVLIVIPFDETVTVIDYGKEWSQVSYLGMSGYVLTSQLQIVQMQETTPPASPTNSPTPTPTPSATPVPTFEPVNASAVVLMNAQLRTEPDTGSTLLDVVPAGTIVTVVAAGTSWSRVMYNGVAGWMLTAQLHITQENTAAPTQEPTATPYAEESVHIPGTAEMHRVTAWISTSVSNVNLRAEASEESKVLAQIAASASVIVLDAGPTWALIEYAGVQGYVYVQHLTYTSPDETLGVRYINTQKDPLALREGPSTTAKMLTRMERGSRVTLLRQEGDWCYIQYGQQTGYCSARYLSADKPGTYIMDDTRLLDYTLTEVEGWEAVIKSEHGTIFAREWCATDAPEVMELENATRVKLLQKGDIWCLITYEGNEGYCLNSHLTLIAPAQ